MGVGEWPDRELSSGVRETDRVRWALRSIRVDAASAPEDDDGASGWAFRAEVSRVLDSASDFEVALEAVGRLAMPVLADYSILHCVNGEDARWRRIVSGGGADPAPQKLLDELHAPPTRGAGLAGTLARVAHGGWVVLHEPTDAELADLVGVDDLGAHRRLGLQSCVALPIGAHDHPLGVLLLASTRPGLGYGERALALVEDYAVRAAAALDHTRSVREAREASRRKDELLALVAHELRTPLGCVVAALEALARPGRSAASARDLPRTALRQAQRLARLVGDLLEVGWVGNGRLPLRVETVDLREVVHDCLDGLEAGGHLARHVVSLDCPPAPVTVAGDRLRLEQVVGNLLDNAAKYTPAGGAIRLTVGVEGAQAVLRLQDVGIGIAREWLPHVFEPFVRAQGASGATGLGLGLTLVRGIVEQHGGTVGIHSQGPGQGTLVVVRLPLTAAPAARRDG
jgi:signal transduction histidine kinase